MEKIFKLKPAYKDYIWGGTRLADEFGKDTPYERTAESWELSCHENGHSHILGGAFDTLTLKEAIESARADGRDMLGTACRRFGDFPILIKLIDANAPLSVQVHPSDAYAKEHGGGFGKCEVWYVVAAEDGAELVYGFSKDVTREQLRSAIEKNELLPYLNFVPVKAGDVFFVEPGKLHAIGKGILICEIQQSSDTTYRVYDWGRVGADGRPRELHIEKSLDVLLTDAERDADFSPSLISDRDGVREYRVAECEYFKVTKIEQTACSRLSRDGVSFAALTFLSGEGCVECGGVRVPFRAGETFFVSAEPAEYTVAGACEYLISEV